MIVMDNASYHSQCLEAIQTHNTRKAKMQDWLTVHGIEYSRCGLKCKLKHKLSIDPFKQSPS